MPKTAARRQRARRRLRLARGGRDRDGRRGRRERRTSSRSPTASAASRASSGRRRARRRSASRRSATARRRRQPPRSVRTSGASTSATIRSSSTPQRSTDCADLICELEPHVILTHAALDPFNPDHGVAHDATVQARQLASGAGVASAFTTDRAAGAADLRAAPARAVRLRPDDLPRHHAGLGQEGRGDGRDGRAGLSQAVLLRARRAPRQPRAADLRPQRHPLRRGLPARDPRRRRRAVTDYAAFAPPRRRDRARGRRPRRRDRPPADPGRAGLARRRARADRALRAGRQLDGARAVAHARAGRRARPDESPSPAPVALVGELLATQAQNARRRGDPRRRRRARPRRARGDRTARSGRAACARRARRKASRRARRAGDVGGVAIAPGDLVVLDCDGAMALPHARVDEVLPLALERESASARCARATRRASCRTT